LHPRLAVLLFMLSGTIPCLAQSQAPLPENYKTILGNDTFKVIKVHYGPHEKVPVHDHPDTPTVYVYLNDSGPVKIIHDEAPPSTIIRPPTHKGAFRVSPGQMERHSIENLSDLPSDFLRVEMPTLTLGDRSIEFRGPAPGDLSHNITATEFTSPRLSVARIICVNPAPCAVPPSPAPSVIVAFSGSRIGEGAKSTTLGLGDVMAVPPRQSLVLSPAGSEPAHVLRIFVKQ
jgi:hypothetical protein